MPTLHLIDADSTQACPAVLSAIHASMSADDLADNALLLLGGEPLRYAAKRAQLDQAQHIAVPFGKATLGLYSLQRWTREHTGFDRVHCWSPGALHAAVRAFKNVPLQLSLVHTPNSTQIRRLAKLTRNRKLSDLRILVDNAVLAERLRRMDVPCETEPVAIGNMQPQTMSPNDRCALRANWGVKDDNERVVVLLSDHPDLADAFDAATIAVLGSATLTDAQGDPLKVVLLIHPMQLHRRRAENLINSQPVIIRLVQDAGITEPWRVLPGCDAAMAMGQDAGGLSLRWATQFGIPLIASRTGPAGILDARNSLRLALSDMHRDLAHQLHLALNG